MNASDRAPLRFDYVWVLAMLVVLLAAWPAWRFWQARQQCRVHCAPPGDAPRIRLTDGTTLPLLSRELGDGHLYVDYVTAVDMRDHARICAEVETAFRELLKSEDLGAVADVMLSPNDPRMRLAGWTWTGPTYSCCVSVGFKFTKEETGTWPPRPIGCR